MNRLEDPNHVEERRVDSQAPINGRRKVDQCKLPKLTVLRGAGVSLRQS